MISYSISRLIKREGITSELKGMLRKLVFFVVAGIALVFVVALDLWGVRWFMNILLKSVAPKADLKLLKIELNRRNDSTFGFPSEFLFGISSSAYQIEGAWNESGKTPSIWDDFVHFHPNAVDDNSTADVGPDSFHNFKEDVAALKLVGVGYQQR